MLIWSWRASSTVGGREFGMPISVDTFFGQVESPHFFLKLVEFNIILGLAPEYCQTNTSSNETDESNSSTNRTLATVLWLPLNFRCSTQIRAPIGSGSGCSTIESVKPNQNKAFVRPNWTKTVHFGLSANRTLAIPDQHLGIQSGSLEPFHRKLFWLKFFSLCKQALGP